MHAPRCHVRCLVAGLALGADAMIKLPEVKRIMKLHKFMFKKHC